MESYGNSHLLSSFLLFRQKHLHTDICRGQDVDVCRIGTGKIIPTNICATDLAMQACFKTHLSPMRKFEMIYMIFRNISNNVIELDL